MAVFAATLSHRPVIFTTAVTSTAGLLTAMVHGVNGRPGATLSFIFRHATLLVSFFDVTRLPFFFVRVFVLVTSWHFHSSFMSACSYLRSTVSRKTKPGAVKDRERKARACQRSRDRLRRLVHDYIDVAANPQRQGDHRDHQKGTGH